MTAREKFGSFVIRRALSVAGQVVLWRRTLTSRVERRSVERDHSARSSNKRVKRAPSPSSAALRFFACTTCPLATATVLVTRCTVKRLPVLAVP